MEIGGTHMEGVSNAHAITLDIFMLIFKFITILKNYLKISYLRIIEVVDIHVRKQI